MTLTRKQISAQVTYIKRNIEQPVDKLNRMVNFEFGMHRKVSTFVTFCRDHGIVDVVPMWSKYERVENVPSLGELSNKLKSKEFKMRMAHVLDKHHKREDRLAKVPSSYANPDPEPHKRALKKSRKI